MVVIKLAVAALLTSLVAACAPQDAPSKPVTQESSAMERWQTLEREISKLQAFLESRIEFLEGRRASLSDSERANLAAASAALGEMKSILQLANANFLAGDFDGAVLEGERARLKVREALLMVGIEGV